MHASVLSSWESFYVIVGSSAAALTGLMFVVIALVHDVGGRGSGHEIAAFGTPNVVHFSAVLLISAVLSAPWTATIGPALVIAAIGVLGVLYTFLTWKRARTAPAYKPVLEDWIWHVWIPLGAYVMLVVAGFGIHPAHEYSMFMVGGSSLLLLFDGIHNAWDTVTYLTLEVAPRRQAEAAAVAAPPAPPAPSVPQPAPVTAPQPPGQPAPPQGSAGRQA